MGDEREDSTVWRDVMAVLVFAFCSIAIILLPHINPPQSGDRDDEAPGNVIVAIRWPDGMDADVDLWVRAPGDVPVGYSNLNGRMFNLLRDDLGNYVDALNLNYENAYTRGIMPGEYIANIHLYSDHASAYPVPVTLQVSVRRADGHSKQILTKSVELTFLSQEMTVARWGLDEHGNLISGSVHDVPYELRSRVVQ